MSLQAYGHSAAIPSATDTWWLWMHVLLMVALTLGSGRPLMAQANAPGTPELTVGVKHAPPFAIKHDDGSWSGISIDLWSQIAADLGLQFTYRETDLAGLLQGLREGRFDVGVAALTITADREKTMDFTHAFHTTGLAIAALPSGRRGWLGVIELLFSLEFLRLAVLLVLVLLLVGILVWQFERKRNADQFGGSTAQGIGSGFWWSAVTVTTVGYGDKAPRTLGGRIVGLLWMFTGILVVASFTAGITSLLTLSQLESNIRSPDDLNRVVVATVSGSTSQAYLQRQGIDHRAFADPGECLRQLAENRVEAAVYDAPILGYLINTGFKKKIVLLPVRFERQDYGLGLPDSSPLRELINQSLLSIIERPEWRETVRKYVGARDVTHSPI